MIVIDLASNEYLPDNNLIHSPIKHAALVAAQSALTEVKLYVDGRFSAVCRSPDTSLGAPYWSINDTILNSTEVIQRYGADVALYVDPDGEGHYLSNITIATVNLSHSNSMISCRSTANMTVPILLYHLTVGE